MRRCTDAAVVGNFTHWLNAGGIQLFLAGPTALEHLQPVGQPLQRRKGGAWVPVRQVSQSGRQQSGGHWLVLQQAVVLRQAAIRPSVINMPAWCHPHLQIDCIQTHQAQREATHEAPHQYEAYDHNNIHDQSASRVMLSCLRKEQASMGHAMLACLAAGKTAKTQGTAWGLKTAAWSSLPSGLLEAVKPHGDL